MGHARAEIDARAKVHTLAVAPLRLLVLSRNASLYSTSRLVLAARARGHEVTVADPLDFQIVVSRGRPAMFVGDRLLDFRASYPHELDTGGANFDILYRDLNPDDYELEYHSQRYAREDVNRKDSVQHYELIDHGTWYHMCASTHDQLVGDGQFKLAYTKGYLDARVQS